MLPASSTLERLTFGKFRARSPTLSGSALPGPGIGRLAIPPRTIQCCIAHALAQVVMIAVVARRFENERLREECHTVDRRPADGRVPQ